LVGASIRCRHNRLPASSLMDNNEKNRPTPLNIYLLITVTSLLKKCNGFVKNNQN
jgi:hypothetical protein